MPYSGVVTLIQQLGSAFNLNIHLYMLFLDGVYGGDNKYGSAMRFHWINSPTSEELAGFTSYRTPTTAMSIRQLIAILLSSLILSCTSAAEPNLDEIFDLSKHDYDEDIGDEINQVCAGCHGEYGMGGSAGKYPRIASLPTQYIIKEIVRFRERKRPNISMVEHVEERQLSNDEVMDISVYLNQIKLKTRMSVVDETAPDFNAYARLQEAKQILQISKAEGDIVAGKKLYKECRSCHGRQGEGDQEDAVPLLAGQYTNYLLRQIDLYISGQRLHDPDDPDEEFFKSYDKEQLRDIVAYISILDD